MLRKLISAIIVFALATIGLSAASPAQAAGTFSPTVALPEAASNATSIPLGDDAQLKIWQGYDDNGHYLKTGILHSDGTWANQPDLATGSTSTYFQVGGQGSWAVSQEGTIAFTWIQYTNNNSTTTSASYIAYTDDGIDWSAPVQVLAPRVATGDPMDCMMGCGYNSLKLSIDSKGTLAAVANFIDGANSSFIVSTSLDGANWSSPTELESATGWGGYYMNIAPLPTGGFLAAWVASIGQTQSFKYSTMSPTNFNFWKRPKVIGSATNLDGLPVLVQTDPTHLSLLYMTGENMTPVLNQRLYDLSSKTWGTPTSLLTGPANWLNASVKVAMGKNWHGAIGVGIIRNGAQEARSYFVELNSSVASEAKVAKSVTQQAMTIDAIRVNFDDSITMMMSGLNRPANIMNFKAGLLVSDEDIPNTPASQIYSFSVTVSPSGNFFISGNVNLGTSSIYEGIVYRAASAPIPVGDLKLTGLAKPGQTVTSKIPTFTGVSNIGTTRIQWYTCTTKVATVQLTIPLTCAAIPKATALKFKVTTKQKNKYLGVAVSNTNAVGTATLFSTLPTKVK